MRRDRLLLGLWLALTVAAAKDASGVDNPSAAFAGDWRFPADARFRAKCMSGDTALDFPAGDIANDTFAIEAIDAASLELDLGCHCPLPLVVDASGTAAHLAATPQPCDLVLFGYSVHAAIDRVDVALTADGGLSLSVSSPSADAMLPVDPLTCTSGAIDATLTRAASSPTACGPDSRAVGVLEFAPQGTIDCRLFAGAEGLEISMEDETSHICAYQSGDAGEGAWVLPQAERAGMQCGPADPTRSPHYNILPFCRVDGARFKPLTADPNDTANFYAVLNLGTDPNGGPAPCPNGSTSITMALDNEDGDDGAGGNGNTSGGRIAPNVVQGAASTGRTTLYFCYFRSAATGAETMTSFPDLGFPYAVFHAFGDPRDPQPPWVILKRWAYSDNQSKGNRDSPPGSDDASALETFGKVIETPTNGAMFNMARVR